MIKEKKFQPMLYIITIIILINTAGLVSAVECGSVPTDGCQVTQDTTFTQGTYNMPSGILFDLQNSITLDCNNSLLIGQGSNDGINIKGSDNLVIKNCIIKNYSRGVHINTRLLVNCEYSNANLFENMTLMNNSQGIQSTENSCFSTSGSHNFNKIANSTFFENMEGIKLLDTTYTNITKSRFENNSLYGVRLTSTAFNSIIFNNTFNQTGIQYDATNDHAYCAEDQIPNMYVNGATGPPCECLPLLDGLSITSSELICKDTYNIPSGISFPVDKTNIHLNCDGATLHGTGGGNGIHIDAADSVTIENCLIKNYSNGIFIDWATNVNCRTADSNVIKNNLLKFNSVGINTNTNCGSNLHEDNKIINNTISFNAKGIRLFRTELSNITQNTIQNNSHLGIELTSTNVHDNLIFQNNFINNTVQAVDSGSNNNWNTTGSGNYWDSYDEASEGCINSNGDLFCDSPYINISGSAASNDSFAYIVENGWLLGLNTQLIPIQVVEDVDLVKGKSTLIRVSVTFTSVFENDTITPNVYLYWNNNLIESNSSETLGHNELKHYDFWYVPTEEGSNIPIKAHINGTSTEGFTFSDTTEKDVTVIETRAFRVDFVAVDERRSSFDDTVEENIDFLNSTYPIAGNSLITGINDNAFDSSHTIGLTLEEDEKLPLLKDIYKKKRLSDSTDRVVGIAPSGWFEDHGAGSSLKGYSYYTGTSLGQFSITFYAKATIMEEGFRHGTAHELGHTLGLCDEYSDNTWNTQNSLGSECPNGDSDNDDELDLICKDSPTGCPVSTIGKLVPWNSNNGMVELYNFMGDSNNDTLRWISEESYSHLSDTFSSSFSFLNVDGGILISGIIDKSTGDVEIDSFSYILDENLILNESGEGNFTIVVEGNEEILHTLIFEPQFLISNIGGNITETNVSAFSFVVPFNESVTKILVEEKGIKKDEVNRSVNTPNIGITSNLSGKNFSNELFNISWNGSDADNDALAYAILFSNDNGSTFQTLEIDFNNTVLELNSSQLPDCDLCKIKVLVSDGINTNKTVSKSFSIDNDLSINGFRIVYQNNTERVFKFSVNNTFDNQYIGNVSWSLDAGESVINSNSSMDMTLHPLEEALIFVYYNYTNNGNFSVSATVFNEQFSERRVINIAI